MYKYFFLATLILFSFCSIGNAEKCVPIMADGEVLTGGSIQQTMWRLIYTDGANPGSSGEGLSSINHIVEMMTEAFDMGEGFVPE